MKRFIAALALALLLTPAGASASSITDLFVFGDSLSDMGNAFALTSGFFPPSPPYAMRFSNGPVAAEYLAANLGIPLTPSTAGGNNFAVGGATTGVLNFNFEVNSPPGVNAFPGLQFTGIGAQLTAFLASGPIFDPATSLFMVWGGPNDIFLAAALGEDVGGAAAAAIGNLASAVATLALGAGAQRFLIPNMANLGATPEFEGTPEAPALTALSMGFNAGLAAAMAALEGALGVDIIVFDIFGTFETFRANALDFGFTNTDTPCLADLAALLAGCPGYLFFDGVHPTTAAHARLGNLFTAAVPEPASLLLLGAGLVAAAAAARHMRRRAG